MTHLNHIAACLMMAMGLPAMAQDAHFSSFHYEGNDSRYRATINPQHQYFNPIMA